MIGQFIGLSFLGTQLPISPNCDHALISRVDKS
jgi:hypothetical protein